MLNKHQIKDSEECERLQEMGEDMDCLECSCSVCIAQAPMENKLGTIQQFISYAEREGVINSDTMSELIKFAEWYIEKIDL